jgi:hypothetical protein
MLTIVTEGRVKGGTHPLNPLESVVVYRPKSLMRQASLPFRAEQLWLFERVGIA